MHRHDSFEKTGYWLNEIAEVWRERGLRVSVLRGPELHVEAGLAVLHVDSTVVPNDYLAFVKRYPKVLNGRVADISKRITSNHLVSPGDGYEGPVIVKTSRNYRGRREAALALKGLLPQRCAEILPNVAVFAKELYRATKELISPKHPGLLRDYSIFESVRQVPRRIWRSPDLVVERFLPERQNGHYCVRTWMFFGDREKSALFYSKKPIIKSANIIGHEPLSDVPEELRFLRQKLGFDFGKFDYGISDGQVVLYDANRTPTLGSFSRERNLPLIQLLSEGIDAYLEE